MLFAFAEGSGTFLLFGGSYDEQSTEVFSIENGASETSFTLEYPSRGSYRFSTKLASKYPNLPTPLLHYVLVYLFVRLHHNILTSPLGQLKSTFRKY